MYTIATTQRSIESPPHKTAAHEQVAFTIFSILKALNTNYTLQKIRSVDLGSDLWAVGFWLGPRG